ncbi:hypothetical protein ACHAWF_003068, partial [Thalassiosira exigua]
MERRRIEQVRRVTTLLLISGFLRSLNQASSNISFHLPGFFDERPIQLDSGVQFIFAFDVDLIFMGSA